MTSITYIRLILFLPYLLLLGAWADLMVLDPQTATGFALHNLMFLWAYSAIYWVVPYAYLLLCLLLWSRGKSFEMIAAVYNLAPCALAVVTIVANTIVQVAIWIDADQMWEDLNIFATIGTITVLVDLIVGYVFVAIARGLYIILKKIGFVRARRSPESAVQPSPG